MSLLVVAALVLAIGLIFVGNQSIGCLGPIGVTQVQCIAAFDAANEPDWSPGPGSGAWFVTGLALLLIVAAIVPLRALSRRSLAILAAFGAFGAVGAVLGAVVYDLTRPVSLTGPTSTGAVITVTYPPNADARLFDIVVGAALPF
jgi:hypothetical protein